MSIKNPTTATDLPEEFTPDYVAANSPVESQLYRAMLSSGQPYRSLAKHNFHHSAKYGFYHKAEHAPTASPTPGLDLDDEKLYYNTTGEAEAYYRNVDLPEPRKDITRLREDLHAWGYCLIDEALSAEQCAAMQHRVREQAAGERLAGIAAWTGTPAPPGEALPKTQFVHCLINKGQQFIDCVEHDPKGVQAAAVIEQLIGESIGDDFLMSSFIAIIANQNNLPQTLHQDQAIAPFQDPAAPFTCNTMFILDDMDAANGGTLVVPGSHKLLSEPASGEPLHHPLPPAINLSAPAGTIMIFEGRLLHGTGVNRTTNSRTILVMNSIKPFMRQQELHLLSANPEVLRSASPKLLYRLGAQPKGLGGVEGAWNGDILRDQRLALEAGEYIRVGQLSSASPTEDLAKPYGYRQSDSAKKQAAHQPEAIAEVRATDG